LGKVKNNNPEINYKKMCVKHMLAPHWPTKAAKIVVILAAVTCHKIAAEDGKILFISHSSPVYCAGDNFRWETKSVFLSFFTSRKFRDWFLSSRLGAVAVGCSLHLMHAVAADVGRVFRLHTKLNCLFLHCI
jgi:hypothetical protein